jgi:transaldolase
MLRNSYQTKVMGASFRNINQILDLTGVHLLTISPNLVQELMENNIYPDPLEVNTQYVKNPSDYLVETQADFEICLESDEMAKDLLEKGISKFTQDLIKLEDMIATKINKVK